jgi:short-subunit dehydrogenase
MVNNWRKRAAEPAGTGVVGTAPEAAARRLATGQLPGALVLVTGAGSGIGRATAPAFAERRTRVLATDIDVSAARRTAAACADRGAESVAFGCDVADWDVCPGVVDTPILSSSRFLGSRGEPQVRARAERVFRQGHAPEVVAEAIVDAVRRDRAVVPVGWEARLGWWGHRLTSVGAQQRIARWGLV